MNRDTQLNVILSIDIRIMYLPAIRLLAMLGGLLYTQLHVILSIDIRIMYLPAIRLLAMLGGLS